MIRKKYSTVKNDLVAENLGYLRATVFTSTPLTFGGR